MAVIQLDIPDETLALLTRLAERGHHGTVQQMIARAVTAWISSEGHDSWSSRPGLLDALADEGDASGDAMPFDGPKILAELRARLAARQIGE